MPGYLLDTNIIRFWFDSESGKHPVVQAAAKVRQGQHPLYVSAITLGEIEYGHEANPTGAGKSRDDFVAFVREELPQTLSVSRHTAEPYGRIRAALFEKFGPKGNKSRKKRAEQLCDPATGRELGVDENDLWIVAQAAERNLVLVTHDKLVRIRDALGEIELAVQIEDWAAENSATT
ncbi:MAG: PIN domain-containing protein [Phycisphaerae bacterium]|nr:PIN domain-containing protein [Phycisphaerae bacterium]